MKTALSGRSKIIISMLIWGTIGLFVRGIDLSSIEIAFFRALLGSSFLICISLVRRDKFDWPILRKNLLILSIAGLALGMNWIALFQGMKYTTISNAILSYYFAPVFIVIFSLILFKEKLSIKNVICLSGAVLGLFLVMKAEDTELAAGMNHMKGIIYGLIGALLYAFVVILNKYIRDLSAFQSTLTQLLIAALVLMPIVVFKNPIDLGAIEGRTWILILIIGIVHTGIAYLLYFSSINNIRSQSVAILSYLDPIVAILTSFIFLQESMNLIQVLGGFLILSTAYINERDVSQE